MAKNNAGSVFIGCSLILIRTPIAASISSIKEAEDNGISKLKYRPSKRHKPPKNCRPPIRKRSSAKPQRVYSKIIFFETKANIP